MSTVAENVSTHIANLIDDTRRVSNMPFNALTAGSVPSTLAASMMGVYQQKRLPFDGAFDYFRVLEGTDGKIKVQFRLPSAGATTNKLKLALLEQLDYVQIDCISPGDDPAVFLLEPAGR